MRQRCLLPLTFVFFLPMLSAQTIHVKSGFVVSYTTAVYNPTSGSTIEYWYKSGYTQSFNELLGGWNISLGVDYLDKKRFFLTSDVGFLKNGSSGMRTYYVDGLLVSDRIKNELQFLTLNTLAHVKMINKDKIVMSFGLGPQVNFLTAHKIPIFSDPFFAMYSLGEHLSPVTLDVASTLVLSFRHNSFRFGFDVVYNYNLLPLLDDHIAPSYSALGNGEINFSLRVNYFSTNFTFGYMLHHKKKQPEKE